MDSLTPQQVLQLASLQNGPCVSIFLATHEKGQDIWQDRVRLKNLLAEAEAKLTGGGGRSTHAREMLRSARSLVDDSDFWQHQSDGLALFISPAETTRLRLPISFPELVVVGSRFHLKPILPLLTGDGLFFILAMSQNQVRLLRCTRHAFEEITSPEFAEGEDSILKFVEEQKQLQWHTQTAAAGPGGRRAAVFHGQGAATRHYKDRIFEYFRRVATTVRALLGAATVQPLRSQTLASNRMREIIDTEQRTPGASVQAPVVFVGVDYLFPIFQQASKGYLHLLDDFVAGNPDEFRISAELLHETAWRVVEPYFDQERQKSADLYREARGTAPHRASNDLADVLRAAHDGRVALSFTALDAHRWGKYDPMTGQSEFHLAQDIGDEDLLDAVTVQTFIHGGRAFVVPMSEMPDRTEVAAVTRF